ncbi:MAG: acetyl-CoA carboxylase biotin carboxyl carrier protein subunit [Clostridia bacterium]|nr:MAG: acetyl-CoA carboxylase biotin carboxyl carrier protein subunit [Clostridia bacterium]
MTEVVSPMPGKVIAINVSIGDRIDEDTPVITLESMKMEVPVFPTDSGKVKEIMAVVGEVVTKGAIVALLE